MNLGKKIVSLLLVAVMLMAVCSSAMAASTGTEYTISVPDGDSHEYEIYQIFYGDLMEKDGIQTLSNLHWGQNGKGTQGTVVAQTTLDDLEKVSGTENQKATTIANTYADLAGTPFGTVKAGTNVTVPAGYYLIKDKTGVTLAPGDEATLYIVQVLGNLEIARKAGTTGSDKTLDDKNDSEPTNEALNGKNQTSSDYDIGDWVPYHVTATISGKASMYAEYKITLKDTLESGKFDDIQNITAKLDGKDIASTTEYTVTETENWKDHATKAGFEVTYTFKPTEGNTLASLEGKVITIDFEAQLGKGAAIGAEGNRNKLEVSYTNNPNTGDMGKAPDKEVITFTYKVVVDKFDEDKTTALPGAGFTLYKVSETDAKAYASITGDAAAKNDAWAKKAIKIFDTTAAEGTSGVANRFAFNGIDDGYYVLCETTTPAGYNTMEPQVFKVEATHHDLTLDTLTGDAVSGTIEFTPDTDKSTLSASVVNNKGSILPETGGMGTTILYVVGGLLVVAAAVLLVTKKRVGAEK